MSTKSARGTKRTCQSGECGARFYDLNRDPITCPICGAVYVIASAPLTSDPALAEAPKPNKEFADHGGPHAPDDTVDEDANAEALAGVEDSEETVAAEDDETFLEEAEEDTGDVSGLIGSVGDDDEET